MLSKNGLRCLICLACGMHSVVNAAPIVERQNINMVANIQAPSDMVITPTGGSWPSVAQVVSWNGTTFSNPAPIGFNVRSTSDVTVSLASPAALVDGLANIPLNVAVNSLGGVGVSIPKLSLLPQVIYSAVDNNGGTDTASFAIAITANPTGMLDENGAPIATPAPGAYTGVVSLVFESEI